MVCAAERTAGDGGNHTEGDLMLKIAPKVEIFVLGALLICSVLTILFVPQPLGMALFVMLIGLMFKLACGI